MSRIQSTPRGKLISVNELEISMNKETTEGSENIKNPLTKRLPNKDSADIQGDQRFNDLDHSDFLDTKHFIQGTNTGARSLLEHETGERERVRREEERKHHEETGS
jgi:hypothetical protein